MSEKFAFILAQKAVRNPDGSPRYQIKQMCRWLQVSTSGFHDWVGRGLSPTQAWRHELGLIIDHIFASHDGTFGYRRVHAALKPPVPAGGPRPAMSSRGPIAPSRLTAGVPLPTCWRA